MKTKDKKKYNKPEISVIKIDHEISLVMMSANPYNNGPDPFGYFKHDNHKSEPFKC